MRPKDIYFTLVVYCSLLFPFNSNAETYTWETSPCRWIFHQRYGTNDGLIKSLYVSCKTTFDENGVIHSERIVTNEEFTPARHYVIYSYYYNGSKTVMVTNTGPIPYANSCEKPGEDITGIDSLDLTCGGCEDKKAELEARCSTEGLDVEWETYNEKTCEGNCYDPCKQAKADKADECGSGLVDWENWNQETCSGSCLLCLECNQGPSPLCPNL